MMKQLESTEYFSEKQTTWKVVEHGVERKIFGYNRQAMLVKVRFKNGAIGRKHSHFHTQMTYIANGSFDVTIGEQTKTLTEGDSFYIPPNTEHGVVCTKAGMLIDFFSPVREDFLDEHL